MYSIIAVLVDVIWTWNTIHPFICDIGGECIVLCIESYYMTILVVLLHC